MHSKHPNTKIFSWQNLLLWLLSLPFFLTCWPGASSDPGEISFYFTLLSSFMVVIPSILGVRYGFSFFRTEDTPSSDD
ncbi:hypothetical protein PZB74_11670 [Porifericola rhodea]|uniref:hypothetical protein n=1 Tax=Porifericola rhodea TaxID=930972 RepID=UPI002665D5ED|nr:hypothetical protein [Porifericola rhodea]WKN29623.1 hypothetical protein PZB74_11670 [Porifericola rhodea]